MQIINGKLFKENFTFSARISTFKTSTLVSHRIQVVFRVLQCSKSNYLKHNMKDVEDEFSIVFICRDHNERETDNKKYLNKLLGCKII